MCLEHQEEDQMLHLFIVESIIRVAHRTDYDLQLFFPDLFANHQQEIRPLKTLSFCECLTKGLNALINRLIGYEF